MITKIWLKRQFQLLRRRSRKKGNRGATLGAALKKAAYTKVRAGIEKLGRCASDENGVRPGSPGSLSVSDAEAKYGLVMLWGR